MLFLLLLLLSLPANVPVPLFVSKGTNSVPGPLFVSTKPDPRPRRLPLDNLEAAPKVRIEGVRIEGVRIEGGRIEGRDLARLGDAVW